MAMACGVKREASGALGPFWHCPRNGKRVTPDHCATAFRCGKAIQLEQSTRESVDRPRHRY